MDPAKKSDKHEENRQQKRDNENVAIHPLDNTWTFRFNFLFNSKLSKCILAVYCGSGAVTNLDVDSRPGGQTPVEDVIGHVALEEKAESDHRHRHPNAPAACRSIM